MRSYYFLLVLLLSVSVCATAQKNKVRYNGIYSAGVLSGQSPAALQLQVVQGVQYKTWLAGIGAGLDYYHTRSVPLFLQVRKTVAAKPQTPFFYVNGGFNVPWAQEEKTMFVTGYTRGFYGEGGIGYEMPVLKKHRLFFSGGWQIKSFSETVNTMPWMSIWPTPSYAFREHNYSLKTLAIKAGLRF
jgi:hypothetical protein